MIYPIFQGAFHLPVSEKCKRPIGLVISYGNYIIAGESTNDKDRIYKECRIHIWNVITGELVTTLTGHQFALVDLKISPNGNLISKSVDGEVRQWDSKILAELKQDCRNTSVLTT